MCRGENAVQFTNEWDYQVNDPRANCTKKYWLSWDHWNSIYQTNQTAAGDAWNGWDGPASSNTLGAANWCTAPWTCTTGGRTFIKQGLPVFWRNGPMETIGEIGHIRTGDVQGEDRTLDSLTRTNAFWQTVNILSYDYGAFMLDRMTTRASNGWDSINTSWTLNPMRGLVCLNTTNTDVLLALYNNMGIGMTNTGCQPPLSASDPNVQTLVNAIASSTNKPYWSFQSLFTAGAPECGDAMATNFENIVQDLSGVGQISEIQRQDPIRKLTNFISFRNNVFEIILAAQVVGSDGTVLSEKRGMATVYRDSYTGRSFVRQFKWLAD
jgi:hypothetical protein